MPAPDYTSLGALHWNLYATDPDESLHPDRPFFRSIVEARGGTTLDVGCATGRLLLPFLEAGLDMEGTDPTADVLDYCRRALDAKRLTAPLYLQAMQTLALPRRYRTAIVPCGTIQLVLPIEEVWEALRRLYAHLEPGGLLVLTLYNHWHDVNRGLNIGSDWKLRSRRPLPDGTTLEKAARILGVNEVEQTLAQEVRYRRVQGEAGVEEVVEEHLCDAPERFFFRNELVLMLERVGFHVARVTGNYSDAPAVDAHYVFAFFAEKPS